MRWRRWADRLVPRWRGSCLQWRSRELLGGANGDRGRLARELPIVVADTGNIGCWFQSSAIDVGTVERALKLSLRAVMLSFGDSARAVVLQTII